MKRLAPAAAAFALSACAATQDAAAVAPQRPASSSACGTASSSRSPGSCRCSPTRSRSMRCPTTAAGTTSAISSASSCSASAPASRIKQVPSTATAAARIDRRSQRRRQNSRSNAHAPSRSPQAVQAVRISLGVRILEAPAADPLDAGGSAAGRGLPRLGAEARPTTSATC